MKIGIFVNIKQYPDINFNLISHGNMGIGGAEYHSLILAYYLTNYEDIECFLYTTTKCNLQKEKITNIVVESPNEAVQRAKEDGIDVFVINKYLCSELHKLIDSLKLNTVTIGHNFYSLKECDEVTQCEYIKRNVFVSEQEYNVYLDLDIIKKSTYIYNFVPFSQDKYPRPLPDENIVTYVGSIVPSKGFHVLAQAWKRILKACPDAKLKVIGSGNLYSRFNKLGKYNIAEEEYENYFMPYLTDENNELLKSVEFLGIMGTEKYDIFKNTKVGVVNPLGISETFCISAVEFESIGVPVVSKSYGGLVNTIKHKKTGLLYKKHKQLASNIIKLLTDENANREYGENAFNFARQTFCPSAIVPQWYNLFKDVVNNKPPLPVRSKLVRMFDKQIKFIRSNSVRLVRDDSINNSCNNY